MAGKMASKVFGALKTKGLKPTVFTLSLIPAFLIGFAIVSGSSGPNPIEYLEKQTGEWTLRFLLLSLLATPLLQLFKLAWPVKLRRMIGLFAFFYATLHFLAYVVLDQSLNLSDIVNDVIEKPYITVGFAAFLILLPLAATSNRFSIRRLGKRWKPLHQWVYLAAFAAVLHFIWLTKGDQVEPVVYLVILLVLLAYRLVKMLGAVSIKN